MTGPAMTNPSRSLLALMSVKIHVMLLPLMVQVSISSIKHDPTTKINADRGYLNLNEHSQILRIVDQPASIGSSRSEGVFARYLSSLAMPRIAGLHAGEAKTDARDAAIITEAACPCLIHYAADKQIAGYADLAPAIRYVAELFIPHRRPGLPDNLIRLLCQN